MLRKGQSRRGGLSAELRAEVCGGAVKYRHPDVLSQEFFA